MDVRRTDGGVTMPDTERLDRTSSITAALAFGLLAAIAPGEATPLAPAPPVMATTPAVAPPSPVVLNERPTRPGDPATVALTFDDGPDPRWTPDVLAVLRRYRAVATFCMVSRKATAHPDLVRDVVAAGMRLCDHTRTHDEGLPFRSTPQMTSEIVGAQEDLTAAADAPVTYFRAPGGNWSPAVLDMAITSAMHPLGWSVDPRDWKRPGVSAIVVAVQRQVYPGAVVLLHDGGGHRDQTVAALEQLLPWLTAQGYLFSFPTI